MKENSCNTKVHGDAPHLKVWMGIHSTTHIKMIGKTQDSCRKKTSYLGLEMHERYSSS